ncbi:MAG: XylR N-terminal domain-containing protein [Myxococcales bacterium]|nr:XylR N-terminal domain-containing protein [Myxococcales bacterium]
MEGEVVDAGSGQNDVSGARDVVPSDPPRARAGLRVGGSPALLHSHAATDRLRKALVHQLGEALARSVVAQAARDAGIDDAAALLRARGLPGDAAVRAGCEYLSAAGYGRLELLGQPGPGDLRVRVDDSPEAAGHLRLFGAAATPACWHLAGHLGGWSSAACDRPMLAVEVRCAACGDAHCELEVRPADEAADARAATWREALAPVPSLAEELRERVHTGDYQLATIQAQRAIIDELSAPILPVADDLLVLPIVGGLDPARAHAMTADLLRAVSQRRARGVLVDVTGAQLADYGAAHIVGLAAALRLLGARVVVTGVSPTLAEALVARDVRLGDLAVARTLADGLRLFGR